MGCFVADREALRKPPLQQIWRDHLLAGALVAAKEGFDEGAFVFLAPRDNVACSRAVATYRARLTDEASFAAWTLEEVVSTIEANTRAGWVTELADRYLAFDRVDACMLREGPQEPCPACGHARSLPLYFGEPTMATVRMAERGEVALGGCVMVSDVEPTWRCSKCATEH